MANTYTKLEKSNAQFSDMLQRFGVVTVMNVDVYDSVINASTEGMTPREILALCQGKESLCRIDTLKVANVTVEGPSKTVTGGQYSNPLIKFGKSARLEMQDALGNAKAIEALCGGIAEYSDASFDSPVALHYGEDFGGPKTIVGDSFFIDQKTGAQVPVKIIFYQFLPDSIFNLTQDAEGDATVFDMNGDLLTTVVTLPGKTVNDNIKHGIFYSIVSPTDASLFSMDKDGKITIEAGYTATLDGSAVTSGTTALAKDQAAKLVISKDGKVVYTTILSR